MKDRRWDDRIEDERKCWGVGGWTLGNKEDTAKSPTLVFDFGLRIRSMGQMSLRIHVPGFVNWKFRV